MYKSFFGLRENPFNGNPDPRYLYFNPNTRKALEQLTSGVQNGRGLILLTGEAGTGKTTLVNHLLNWLRTRNTPTAFIFNSHLSVNHLLDFILSDFGVPIDFRLNGNMLMRLKVWLMERCRAGEKPVLIVDEAQGLSIEALEEVRLLLNLEIDTEKLLQIVLVGQPELEEKLKLPALAQLRQRIELRCSTAPLRLEESRCYIAERLRIAGMNGNAIFPGETMDAAHFYSKGIPRVMNLLCEHALINAFADELRQVPASAVQEAARDFLLTETPSGAPRQRSDSGCDPAAIRSPLEEELIQRLAVIETGLCEGALGIGPFLPTVSGIDLTEGLASANEDAASVLFFSAPLATARPGRNLLSAVMGMLTFRPKSDLSGTASSILAPSVVVPPWIRTLVYLLELRMRVFGAVRRNRPFLYARQTLRTWVAEFKRDWIAMMEAVEFPQVRKTLLQWLRQPAASKRMDAERKQPV